MPWVAFRFERKRPEFARIRIAVLATCLALCAPSHAAQRTIEWADEICSYKLRFDPGKYDADRLRNTADFVFARRLMRFPIPQQPYMSPPEGEVAAYKEVCSQHAGKLSSFPMIGLPGLEDYRNMLLLELQGWCDFWVTIIRGSQGDTAALRSFAPSAGYCSIYIDALEGKVDAKEVWRQTVISSCARNNNPKACEAGFLRLSKNRTPIDVSSRTCWRLDGKIALSPIRQLLTR